MELRPELLPPPVSRQRLDELCAEVERIADLLEARPEAAGEAIAAFNAMTGHEYEARDFAEYDGSRSLEEFAREAARPARPMVADITRDELVEIVRRLLMADLENDYYLRLLEANWSGSVRDRLLFATLSETGMRLGECLSLKHCDWHVGRGRTPFVEVVPRQDHPAGVRVKNGRFRRIYISDDLERLHSRPSRGRRQPPAEDDQ
ncbi:hypothetical protein ACFYWX_43335 [Streptomyces sp. NPDC002888]|uniref:hypothetical protein n=1 Tax=Streptomyces sp. NPDC002888 TaxID=3364668 RepID=UPI00368641BC